jgi:2-polyprenyl-6-methoxyphenol hydroxylase-like FAD-dependent oxidoreductase
MLPVETDVLIVGAGPTGLALAASLRKAGVDHVLVDALEGPHNTSRAAVVHAHTLEMLGAIDVVGPMEANGIRLSHFTVRDRDQPLLRLRFDDLPSPFQHLLMIPQSTTEALLQTRLVELGGEVHRGVSALGAMTEGDGAVVRVQTADGEQAIRARHVVGADGMHSVIREAAGIGFHGEAYGESFILADVRMDWRLADEVSLFFSPAGLLVVAPLPDDTYRIVATVDDAPEKPAIADIQRLLDARGPTGACRVTGIGWASRFRVHHRLADSYRSGPFLLMGDAAHVHSPAGGQGMNTGLVDAIVLGEALTRVVRDGAPESVLDGYARTRRPAAEAVLTLAFRLTRVATLRSAWARATRNLVLRLLNRLPKFNHALALSLSGLARRRFGMLPQVEALAAHATPARAAQSPLAHEWRPSGAASQRPPRELI